MLSMYELLVGKPFKLALILSVDKSSSELA